MSGWESFFVAQVGASAALAGLIFVAVSLNLDDILKNPNLPRLALEALLALLSVLLVSSLVLVPGQSPQILGAELLLVGVANVVTTATLHIQGVRRTDPKYRIQLLTVAVIGQIATLPFVIAGIAVIVRGEGGLYWLVPGILFLFLVAFLYGWVLLIEIRR